MILIISSTVVFINMEVYESKYIYIYIYIYSRNITSWWTMQNIIIW